MKTRQRNQELVALTSVEAVTLSQEEDERLKSIASDVDREHGVSAEMERYKKYMLERNPVGKVCTLRVDDFSAFSDLSGVSGVGYYPSRAYIRARSGDVIAAPFEEIPGYREYLDTYLGLKNLTHVAVPPKKGEEMYTTVRSILADDESLNQLTELAREGDAFVIDPFMSIPEVWELAEEIAQRNGVHVEVLAPLPMTSTLANNKVHFLDIARRVLGDKAVITGQPCTSVDEMIVKLQEYMPRADRVALQLSDSASGMGLTRFQSAKLAGQSPQQFRKTIEKFAKMKGWDSKASPPVVAEIWESDVLASPSVQVWIPPIEEGLPIVEGVFEQQFIPPQNTVFMGSVISKLPAQINAELSDTALRLARVYQYLGYIGRFSLDSVAKGEVIDFSKLIITECNGRWGGTSHPMSFMNRLFGDYRRQPYKAADFVDKERLAGVQFDRFASELKDVLYDRRMGKGWAILYNVGCLEPVGKIDVLTLGDTLEQAQGRQKEFKKIIEERF